MTNKTDSESIVLGGGCFWCLEAVYQRVRGVEQVSNGYSGGQTPQPDYQSVSSSNTGHAEVVKVDFDPNVVTLEQILDIFWQIHDPTTPNRQGNDVGSQYRSIILYANEKQKAVIDKSLKTAANVWSNPIVTEVKPLEVFYQAEVYHQNYFDNHPEQAYCQVVINPKLTKLNTKFADLVKD